MLFEKLTRARVVWSVVVVLVMGVLGGAAWAFAPLLYDREVNEEFPVAASSVEEPEAAVTLPVAPTDTPAPTTPPQPVETATAVMEPQVEHTTVPTVEPTAAPTLEPTAEPTPTPTGPVALSRGTFIPGSVPGDESYGSATVYRLEDESLLLRLEDFSSTNGPDLFVALSDSDNPDRDGLRSGAYLQLEALKGNIGNQNYVLPADIDLSQYRSVVVWCRAFDIVFGYAVLQPE